MCGSETYNGWRNRETWLVNVWFGDDWACPGDVDYTESFIEEAISDLPVWIQDFIDTGCIDWDELRSHFAEVHAEVTE